MGIFGDRKKDKRIKDLEQENMTLKRDLTRMKIELSDSEKLCHEKDDWMSAMSSEALRKGSSFGGKVLADKKKYLKENK